MREIDVNFCNFYCLVTFKKNQSAVRNGEEAYKTGENMGGAVEWSVAQKFD